MIISAIFGAMALLSLMVSLSATVTLTIISGIVTAQIESENRAILSAAAQQMASEASNIDGDSVPEFTRIRAAVAGEPALPVGGWYIAATSAAPKADAYGSPLIVCAVDNGVRGTQPELAGLIAGVTDPTQLNAAPLFAIIMTGDNGQLETDCATALAGNASGDDRVRRVSVAEGMTLAGPLVATAPTTVEYGTSGIGSNFKVNGGIASESLAVSGAASAAGLTLGTPLTIGNGGTSASSAAGAWLAILNGAPPTSLAWQVAGAVQLYGGTINGIGIGATTPASGNFTALTVNGAPVWTAANDGAGSGLDADRLDGVPVQATGASNGNVLQYNGTGWVPGTLQAGGGGTVGLVEADTFQTVTSRGSTTSQIVTAAGYQYSSDPRWKVDMRPIGGTDALSMVMRLQGLRYTRLTTAEQEIGFNAEEVEQVIPDLVRVGPDGYRSLAYGNLTAVLVEATHEVEARLRAVEAMSIELDRRRRATDLAAGWLGGVILAVGVAAVAWSFRRRRSRSALVPAVLFILALGGSATAVLPSQALAQSCPGGVPGSMRCIAAGATADIDAYGTCRRVTNIRPLAVMIPLGSAADWASARSGAGAVVAMSACYAYAWSGWSGWSGCSASCGGGSQSQSRSCQRSETGVAGSTAVDPSFCGGGATTQSQSCNTQSCCTPSARIDGYGGCSASCGGGSQTVYWSDGCGASWTSSQSCNQGSCCAGNQGQQCNHGWCDSTGGNSCANWYATPTSCGQGDGTGSIASCDDGSGRICCNDNIGRGRVQCDGSCQ